MKHFLLIFFVLCSCVFAQSQPRARATGNATVPNDAPIQPPQAFVDCTLLSALTGMDGNTIIDWSNKGITGEISIQILEKLDVLFNACQGNGLRMSLAGNAITNTDAILADLASNGYSNGSINLSGVGMTAPTKDAIGSITIVAGGADYIDGEALIFTGGGGSGAAGTIQVTGGVITGITLTDNGTDYISAPTVSVDTAGGTGANLTAVRKNPNQIILEANGATVTTN